MINPEFALKSKKGSKKKKLTDDEDDLDMGEAQIDIFEHENEIEHLYN